MSKVNLADLVNLQNETTAVTQINSNSHAIEAGFDNTLSRDGTSPNSMNANLDMNSNRIFNLPIPSSATEPLRFQDLSDFIGGGTISSIPAGGTTRQYLGKNSNTNFDTTWLTVRDPLDVRNFGVIGNGIVDDSDALQAAIDALSTTNGGIVYIPQGMTILCTKPIRIIHSGARLIGASSAGAEANVSTLIYSGTGARFIDARDTAGFVIENIRVQYSSSSFAGNLIDLSSAIGNVSAYPIIRECILEPNTSRTGTATLINLAATVDALVEKNFFRHGLPCIVGQAIAGQNVRTTIRNNTFSLSDSYCIVEGGESWVVEGNSFEPRTTGIGQAFVNTVSKPCIGMTWFGNWFGDITVGTGTVWIDGYFDGLNFSGNTMYGEGTIGGVGIKLNSSAGITMAGNKFRYLAVGVNCATAGTGLTMGANTWVNCTAPIQNSSNITAGDFTVSSAGDTSITNNAVTFAKMQTIPTATVLGNFTGSTAVPQAGTVGGGFVITGTQLNTAPFTGDVTSPSGSFVTTLATVNSNVGTFGSATQTPQVTVNGKGLTTAASNVTITPAVGSITGLGTGVGTFLATPTSANLAAAITNETGTGNLVFSTSPALTTPTGIVKGDVGLGNVDNTSDATKNSAVATLTNKTLTSPVVNTPTGIVKGDVGLGNVDNTSDTTKWAATKTLTNTTYDTAGAGNSFSINGVAATANTGTGSVVRATSPTLVTPTLGAATATTVNGNTLTTGTYTLTGTAAKTLTFNNSLTLAGTDSTTMTFPGTSATVARTDAANTFTGHQTVEGVTSTGATGTGKFVFDTSPTLVTPVLGAATATTINSVTIDNNAWSTYTSTFGATTGTATVVAKQKTLGKLVFVNIDVTYTSAITGQATVTLPTNSVNTGAIQGANLANGTQAFGDFNAGTNSVNIFKYDGTQITANGSHIIISGIYEAP